jgi:hypothetical protein
MSVYNQPKVVPNADISYQTDPNNMSAMESGSNNSPARRVSMGNPGRNEVKTSGVVQRGCKNTSRGKTSRGPLA